MHVFLLDCYAVGERRRREMSQEIREPKGTGKRDRECEREHRKCRDERLFRRENARRSAPEGYKFVSMQHKVASTTSRPIHQPIPLPHSPFCSLTPQALRHKFGRSYRSRQLKTCGNHRGWLWWAPLGGLSCICTHLILDIRDVEET